MAGHGGGGGHASGHASSSHGSYSARTSYTVTSTKASITTSKPSTSKFSGFSWFHSGGSHPSAAAKPTYTPPPRPSIAQTQRVYAYRSAFAAPPTRTVVIQQSSPGMSWSDYWMMNALMHQNHQTIVYNNYPSQGSIIPAPEAPQATQQNAYGFDMGYSQPPAPQENHHTAFWVIEAVLVLSCAALVICVLHLKSNHFRKEYKSLIWILVVGFVFFSIMNLLLIY